MLITVNLKLQVVRISQHTCTCQKWQCYHLPCSHVMAACAKVKIDFYRYVDRCYTINEYHQSYAPMFQPIPHQDYWSQYEQGTIIIPDKSRLRQKGRPRSTRIRNDMDVRETGSRYRCGICHGEGHDRRTCPTQVFT